MTRWNAFSLLIFRIDLLHVRYGPGLGWHGECGELIIGQVGSGDMRMAEWSE